MFKYLKQQLSRTIKNCCYRVKQNLYLHARFFVVFGEFSPFFCSFQVVGVSAIDFPHKITPKWIISEENKKFCLPSLVNVKWREPGEFAPVIFSDLQLSSSFLKISKIVQIFLKSF